jgi:hypothetical protein
MKDSTGHVAGIGLFLFLLNLELVFFLGVFHADAMILIQCWVD